MLKHVEANQLLKKRLEPGKPYRICVTPHSGSDYPNVYGTIISNAFGLTILEDQPEQFDPPAVSVTAPKKAAKKASKVVK